MTALRADATLTTLVAGRVYDEPPDPVTRPFVRIGNIEATPLRAVGVATAGEITFGIEVHSRPGESTPPTQGRVEAARIAQAVIELLDTNESALSPTGFSVITLEYVTTVVDREDDGRTYVARVLFDTILDA